MLYRRPIHTAEQHMLKWWKRLTQNNQVVLVVPVLVAVLGAAGYLGKGWIVQPNPLLPVAVIVVYHSELLILTFLLLCMLTPIMWFGLIKKNL